MLDHNATSVRTRHWIPQVSCAPNRNSAFCKLFKYISGATQHRQNPTTEPQQIPSRTLISIRDRSTPETPWSPVTGQSPSYFLSPQYQTVFDTGKPVRNFEVQGQTAAAPGILRDWIADFYPVMQDDYIFAVGACVREVTEQAQMVSEVKAQNELQKLLMGELHHRVKNTLTIIRSISKFLLKGVDDPAIYQERLEDRLGAISRTHDLLTISDWTSAKVSEFL